MKNTPFAIHLAVFAIASVSSAFALECPKETLNCRLDQVNKMGTWTEVKKVTAAFEGVNTDEPSETANECVMGVQIPDAQGNTFNAVVKSDLETFVYFGPANTYGVLDPQASFTPEIGKDFNLYYKSYKLTCQLVR